MPSAIPDTLLVLVVGMFRPSLDAVKAGCL
jgi:hypothetical protein